MRAELPCFALVHRHDLLPVQDCPLEQGIDVHRSTPPRIPSILGAGHAGDREPAFPAIGGIGLVELLAGLPERVGGVPARPVVAARPGAGDEPLLRFGLGNQYLEAEPARLLLRRLQALLERTVPLRFVPWLDRRFGDDGHHRCPPALTHSTPVPWSVTLTGPTLSRRRSSFVPPLSDSAVR